MKVVRAFTYKLRFEGFKVEVLRATVDPRAPTRAATPETPCGGKLVEFFAVGVGCTDRSDCVREGVGEARTGGAVRLSGNAGRAPTVLADVGRGRSLVHECILPASRRGIVFS